eukprot:COSAG03_NODE_1590_length_3822_cov_24.176739_2_plen_34_part_00
MAVSAQQVGETVCREGVPRALLLLSWRRRTSLE